MTKNSTSSSRSGWAELVNKSEPTAGHARQPRTTRPKKSNPRPPPKVKGVPELYAHQKQTVEFIENLDASLDASDPGTGKTAPHLTAAANRIRAGGRACLVIAPKSLLETAWLKDLRTFFGPEFIASIAWAANREEAFKREANFYITNTDAVNWLAEQRPAFFERFDEIIIDEAHTFKHRTSARSKALRKIQPHFQIRRELTGTPNSRTITDIWNLIYFLDKGVRLGDNFFRFQNAVCEPVQVGPQKEMRNWIDKEGIEEVVGGLISDITIRHKFEECTDIPENVVRHMKIDLCRSHRKLYDQLANEAVLELKKNTVIGINEAVLTNKLIQACSGSVYGVTGAAKIDTTRYELIIELVKQRRHSIVFFLWDHQKDALVEQARKEGITYEIIAGNVSNKRRTRITDDFQAGHYQTLFLHPKTGAFGLTLTRGTTTIWASPTYEPDVFKQGTHRIYRTGQTERTETICIQARNTIEERVYQRMYEKNDRMVKLLGILE